MITTVIIQPYHNTTNLTQCTFKLNNTKDNEIKKINNNYYLFVKGKKVGKIKDLSSIKDKEIKKILEKDINLKNER